jgi:Tripartite tricarboxylate transporter family receptor
MTGAARVAKAAPDGYQFVLGNSATHAQNQSLYKRPMYNPVTDFSPVTVIYHSTAVLIARKDFPAKTLDKFITYVKANQTTLQYGSGGAGSASHTACVLLTPTFGRRFSFRRGHPRRLLSGSRARPAMPWTRRLCANASRTSDCASLGRRKGCPNILPSLSRLRSRNGRGQSRRAA